MPTSRVIPAGILSPLPQFAVMRLWSLYNFLFLLCLCAIPGLAAGRHGRTPAFSRPHKPRRVDRIAFREYTHLQFIAITAALKLKLGERLTRCMKCMTSLRYERSIAWPDTGAKGPTAF